MTKNMMMIKKTTKKNRSAFLLVNQAGGVTLGLEVRVRVSIARHVNTL